ncbi:MAG: hypothetical protein COV59_03265 [Candidatus Magasanikbacteria bacterium CG11_big_fil_rev_8_21_14_0_20_39_34]|uniref:Phosphatidylglycerol--prolipoprotein diacylglyceryl transferase n=1 Tax=Candidatus Magasanikbacteria bacterium CG11_big_fil_rev_8_21_14_0_20_39_34 TaxID=1974653 RepID=A0A2H0N5M0_9BACT|nr:MAG: hypothetical protein COV59_03265 [Candidatus Magasanikbacteria bacterium CG11_big_fil_rev_8_21_14_0_20_39_34]
MIPYFQFTVVHLGPIPIQVWGFFVALGMLLSVFIIYKRAKRLFSKEVAEKLIDMASYAILFGLVFSRVFHILFYDLSFYLAHPIDIIKVWEGGLSSYGGFVGAFLGGLYYARKKASFSKKDLSEILDIFAFGAVFGWIVGRVGCFLIHDHPGTLSHSLLALKSPGGPRLDMALMEILAMIPLALAFFFVRKKKFSTGFFAGIVAMYYGFVRFFLDFYRATDLIYSDVRILGLTPAQYFSIVLFCLGVWIFLRKKKSS